MNFLIKNWIYSLLMLIGLTNLGCHKDNPPNTPKGRMLGEAIQYSTNDLYCGKTLIGDLNGDHLDDVVIEAGNGKPFNEILIYYQNSSGGLDPPVVKYVDQIRGFAIGDVNGDGKNDLVVSGSALTASGWPGRIYIFYQNSSGDLLRYVEDTLSFDITGDVAIGDLNSDGRNDIAVLGEWERDPGLGTISIFFQNANGTLGHEVIYNNSPVSLSGEIYIADMNNDGKMDIVFQSGVLQLAVLKQMSSGTFDSLPDYYSVKMSYYQDFYTFTIGDINADNRNDIVVLDPGDGGFMNIFLQNADGSLGPPIYDTVNITPYGIVIADINEDGLNDILGDVVEPQYPPIPKGHVYVFYQSTNHSFGTPADYTFQTISAGGSPYHRTLAVGDVTGDGHKDVAVTWANEGLFILPSIPKQ